ncbi:MAG: hypothetical protein ABWY55_04875, partial [Microbacterium sp.]
MAVAVGAIVAATVIAVLAITEQLSGANSGPDLRPLLLLVGLVGLNCITYVVWMNRWNIVAHTALAFSIVAYVIPIVSLSRLDGLSSAALDLYYQVIVTGFFFAFIGVLIGAWISRGYDSERLVASAGFMDAGVQERIRRRVLIAGALCVAGVAAAFAVMGFVPALTDDPLTAKFFRGAYAAAYQPVAPLYRGATSILSVLLPIIFLYAMKLRRLKWVLLAASALVVLLLGLMRDPAASGILLLLGVYIAVRRKPWILYFAILVGTYFIGGAMYFILGQLGFSNFGDVGAQADLLTSAAAGAPDISDQLLFLNAWLRDPQYTYGLTWLGGLIPGNNPWNPSVWSLSIVNPTQEITAIASGGLRLPPPIWGLVSFGWPGVVLVSVVTGAIQGFLAGIGKRVIPSTSIEASTYWLVLYACLTDVLP